MNDREEIITLLTQDSYYRKIQEWPLITLNDYLNKKVLHHYYNNDMLYLEAKYGIYQINNIEEISEEIATNFPHTRELLIKFQGHLVAAGGAVMNSCYGNRSSNDIDFFFWDLTVEEADQMRLDVIDYLIELYRDENDDKINFHIQRNEYVTTVRVETDNYYGDHHVYQFIHRIYPNISLILGGFDLSISMLAYDGDNIYGTPLGFWSFKNRTIIVDTKRRSTSFEHRLFKYHNRYRINVLFPGISEDIIRKHVCEPAKDYSFNTLYEKMKKLAEEHGFEPENGLQLEDEIENIFIKSNNVPNSYQMQKQENILPNIKVGMNNKFYKIRNYPYDKENIEDRLIDRSSDYGSSGVWSSSLPHINSRHLRFDRLSAVCSTIVLNIKDEDILTRLLDEISNPCIDFDLDHYYKIAKKAREVHNRREYDFYRLLKCFGKLTPEVIKIRDTDKYDDYVQIMVNKMITNANLCRQNLIGIKWITENPGRQWTSSINPIIADPRNWYGKYYIPVVTGIPEEIETCLRLARLRHPWNYIDNDVFNIIMSHLLRYYAERANQYIY